MTTNRTDQKNSMTGELDSNSVTEFQEGVNHVALGVILISAALIGIWGVVCLISGLASGGIGSGWITAITGM